ncbi:MULTISPECIES: hypothetical protein [unclassified Methylobacterium]|uniref:hypothetical protein n=1 Tax=unclassified Methylobacterium TaxID=2615210 RepID=UPI0005BC534A|nr:MULTISPECIES: hypothetical protein [unclassified Methylobacterium]SFU67785.1 hypothetical protein SAMN02799643_01761 [Methylobacterium sp. UNCCL125]
MTALNAILRPDAAYLITDGESRQSLGGLPGSELAPRPKVLPLPHMNAALASRGSAALLPILYSRIAHLRSTFEEAAAFLGTDLQDTVTGMRQKMPDLAMHDVVLIGWPESRDGPECWLAVDHSKWGPPAFEAIRVSGVVSPDDGSLAERMGGREVLEDSTFDPETESAALIEAQGAMPAGCVGAFVQLTTIRRDRIETRIVKWFEDQFELQPTGVEGRQSRREELFQTRGDR